MVLTPDGCSWRVPRIGVVKGDSAAARVLRRGGWCVTASGPWDIVRGFGHLPTGLNDAVTAVREVSGEGVALAVSDIKIIF